MPYDKGTPLLPTPALYLSKIPYPISPSPSNPSNSSSLLTPTEQANPRLSAFSLVYTTPPPVKSASTNAYLRHTESEPCTKYSLTLAENIGVGFLEHSSDMDLIRQAAEEGGAVEVMKKLEDGYETQLNPMQESFSVNLYNDKQHTRLRRG